jgi:tetratricopeptide (TPR) repeat protein
VVVERLGLARRRQLHRRAAAGLEARLRGRRIDATTAGSIARHLVAAGDEAGAARFHVLAADAARAAFESGSAADHYRAALGLGHPDRVALIEALGDAETLAGRYGEAMAAYELGAALADDDRVADFEHRLGSLHLRRGAVELADLHLSAALARLATNASVLRGRVLADRSLVAARTERSDEAAELANAALATARAATDPETEAQAENVLGMLARRAGRASAARDHLHRSLDRAGAARRLSAQVAALNNLALVERSVGDLDAALAFADEALRRSVAVGDRHREAALRNNRADLLHALGRRAEAEAEQMRAVAAFAEVGERPGFEPEIWKLVDW